MVSELRIILYEQLGGSMMKLWFARLDDYGLYSEGSCPQWEFARERANLRWDDYEYYQLAVL